MTTTSDYVERWEKYYAMLDNAYFILPNGQRKKDPITLKNMRRNLVTMINLWADLKADGYDTLILRHLNQDSLENTFGYVRHVSGSCDNPTVAGFAGSYKCIIAIKSNPSTSELFNCADDEKNFWSHWKT